MQTEESHHLPPWRTVAGACGARSVPRHTGKSSEGATAGTVSLIAGGAGDHAATLVKGKASGLGGGGLTVTL